ncbi:MAG: FTR1 family iron permease [Thiobacillus sp.]
MGNAAFIVWRETIEAMLVIGILHGWLAAQTGLGATQRRRAFGWLWGGVAAGLALAGLLALTLLGVRAWGDDATLEWFQAGMPLVAAALIFQMVVWMRRHGAGLKRELEAGMSVAAERAHWAGMALLAVIAVGREGAETVIFLYGAAGSDSAAGLLAGGGIGFLLALAVYAVLARGARWFSWRAFFRATEILLLLLGGALLVDGVDKLIGLEVLPPMADPLWDAGFLLDDGSRLGGLLAAFTGWRSQPAGLSYLALAAWWTLAAMLALRARPASGRT